MSKRTKHIVEYALLRTVTGVVAILPRGLAFVLVWPLARLSYCFMGKRVHEARRRMRQVFGEHVDEKQLKRWAWISWRNIFFNVVEISRTPRWKKESLLDVIDHQSIQTCMDYQKSKGGFTIAVSHMGNWELAGVGVRMLGLPIFVMMRGQTNPYVTNYLNRIREQLGVGAIERHSRALGSIIKRIRAGEVFTILPDLRAKSPDGAILTPFLGGNAYLNAGMALFARHTDTPIFPVIVVRKGWMRHALDVQTPIYPDQSLDKDADIARMTAEVMAIFDRAIRKHPEQYFWYNKRWVLDDRF
ncbi:MAG TPA: hypothetical protein PJ991_12305 [Kiritimatiellia bacterium]|nr:hypothetical protein [Kiritimatiellia bacterium]